MSVRSGLPLQVELVTFFIMNVVTPAPISKDRKRVITREVSVTWSSNKILIGILSDGY